MLVEAISACIEGSRANRLLPRRGPMIVMYHGLGGSDGVRPDDFGAQLDLLSGLRRVVPLHRLFDLLDDARSHELAAITFDDGYTDFADIAVPALRSRGLHATVFVPAGLIGKSNVWDEGSAPSRPILDSAGLRDLDPEVVEIGGHGFSHCRMVGLGPEELERETAECRRILEAETGRQVRLFAYPYGMRDDFDAAAEAAVQAAGFWLACSTSFGRGNDSSRRYRLRRVGIEPSDDLAVVVRKFNGAYDWVAWKEALGYRLRRLRGD